jgi:trehalose synthase
MTTEHTDRQLIEVDLPPAPLERLGELLPPEQAERLRANITHANDLLEDRIVWNINSTASGGGVAEMLQALIAYAKGAGVDTRWLVLQGDPPFFTLTKRIHNFLHGADGDGGALGSEEHTIYDEVLRKHHGNLLSRVRSGDIVLLHDPQTAGLVDVLREHGAFVIWRCHIGADSSNQRTEEGWNFLRGYVENAHALVFTREQYAPNWVPRERLHVIPPSIDPFSLKNMELDDSEVDRILQLVGLARESGGKPEPVSFTGRHGTAQTVRRHGHLTAGLVEAPPAQARLVVQVSRWDRLKDMAGVMAAFADSVAHEHPDSYLLLVGPSVDGVSDDPEGAEVLAECEQQWKALPDDVRDRVLLIRVPMDDLDENAVIVNAIQRRAQIVVQKSFAEGFGLTVTEAMWKARPMVASTVGGIPDQIDTGVHGILVDPHDRAAAGAAIAGLLDDPDAARRMGDAARERVRTEFLGDRHLAQYLRLFHALIEAASTGA